MIPFQWQDPLGQQTVPGAVGLKLIESVANLEQVSLPEHETTDSSLERGRRDLLLPAGVGVQKPRKTLEDLIKIFDPTCVRAGGKAESDNQQELGGCSMHHYSIRIFCDLGIRMSGEHRVMARP